MSPPGQKKPCILLVDDDRHLLLTLGDYLRFKNFDVLTAASGEEALDALSTETPDLIILDIGMPGIGGIGFLKKLDEQNRSGAIPTIIFTARSSMEEFFNTLDVDDFLAKPCSEDTIFRKIKEVLARRNADAVERIKPERKVMLVEDDYETIQELQRAFRLGPRSLTLDVATTASEALERVTGDRPDLVLAKEVLRGMNGDEMAALLRVMPSTRSVPVILYDRTELFSGMREFRYRVYGRAKKFVGAADGFSLYDAACTILDR